MKRYIQGRYFMAYYNAANIPLRTLKRIILEAWNAVPNSYIQTLFNSFNNRCRAVIAA
jgi:hypothetical protein